MEAHVLHAQDVNQQQAALKLIHETANELCTTVPIEGGGQNVDLTGSAQAKLTGVISKVVDLGVDGAAKYQSDTYKGVLRQELAAAIKNGNDCRLSVFNTLVPKLLTNLPAQQSFSTPPSQPLTEVEIHAVDRDRGLNVYPPVPATLGGPQGPYGDVLMIAPPYDTTPRKAWAEWDFETTGSGTYKMIVNYASGESRPVAISINGTLWKPNALATTPTPGCFAYTCRGNVTVGNITLRKGYNTVRFSRENNFPHLSQITFIPQQ